MSPVSQPATDIELSAEATLSNPTERRKPVRVVTNDVRMRMSRCLYQQRLGLSRDRAARAKRKGASFAARRKKTATARGANRTALQQILEVPDIRELAKRGAQS
jgi:hypothetical protein